MATPGRRPEEVDGVTLVERLRGIELFADLDDEQLAWLAEAGRSVELADGEVLFEDGEPARFFYVLLSGELLITKVVGGREQLYGRHSAHIADGEKLDDKPRAAHQFTGEMPLLSDGGYVAKATAHGRTELVAYDKETFLLMVARFPQICRVLLPVLAWRIRSYEARAGRNLMLEGLGTLAAGLAHELNNPTAAVVRAAGELRCAVRDLIGRATGWCSLASPAERCLLASARDLLGSRPAGTHGGRGGPGTPGGPGAGGAPGGSRVLDELAAAEEADLVTEWLAERGVSRADEVGVTLVDHGLDLATVRDLTEGLSDEVLDRAIGCLNFSLLTETLVEEVAEAGRRIEALVGAARAYTNLDRAPVRDVDVHEGLEATLTMQRSKLAGIRVCRDYGQVPAIMAFPSELNQVWTNLIDNAADAMGGHGELRIRTRTEHHHVVVEIADTGSGIPAERLSMIFQPFFTTKDVGKGTGLGLHLSHDIITRRHKGSIEVCSNPGSTRFTVRLPAGRPA